MGPRERRIACLALSGLAVAGTALGGRARDFLGKPDAWFGTDEAARVAANILSHQSARGGWPKNTNTTSVRYEGDPAKLRPTFDNGATMDELRLLARAHGATSDECCARAFLKGLDYVLEAQHPSGGWPQRHPPGNGYHRHITFNDGVMVRVMEFLREVASDERYRFVDAERREAARRAFDRGVGCILRCQIRVGTGRASGGDDEGDDGKLTGWCAQHDEKDFRPRKGRSYELASISGAESVGIVRLLMSIDDPGPEVVLAVEGAVAWFEAAALRGIRVEKRKDERAPGGYDTVVVRDADAPPLWARFYEIGTDRPIFCDRDGVPKRELAEIGHERRNGYAWLGSWPRRLLEREYPAWKARLKAARTKVREAR